ncbi:MAG: hydroxymethylglutaryl-CoA reductase [Kiritimatiellae bacterium]|nr:hydroxymethylglutaryl-CoA reductase [Kiritimatiellia bacterium]
MRWVGPIRFHGGILDEEVCVPLATYEVPLWPSVERGARVSREAGGIAVRVHSAGMTRSVVIEAASSMRAMTIAEEIRNRQDDLARAAEAGSRYARLIDLHVEVCGPLIFVRLAMNTGDAAGHNMVTRAAQQTLDWLTASWPELRAVTVSGNLCSDKKVSAINGLLGRGWRAVAELAVEREVCRRLLRTEPETIAELNIHKNLIGSQLAGSIRSANAHFANMLLAIYLATGQDAANIVEGSQGFTLAFVRGETLRFSVTLPNLIVGTVGAGKESEPVAGHLRRLGCREQRPLGENARRLAAIIAGVVLCGELSLLASLGSPGDLVRAHLTMERRRARRGTPGAETSR